MEKKRFRVRLVRPVFEYTDVEVEAGEEFEAVTTALQGRAPFPPMHGAGISLPRNTASTPSA